MFLFYLSDKNKGITNITYNYLNLSEMINFTNGTITFLYDANGNKLRKTVSTGVQKDYLGGIEYNNGAVEAVYHEEGRVIPQGSNWRYEYNLKDQLGNTRVVFTDNNNDGTPEIVEEFDYYPFGMQHENSNTTATNHYLYNGKELNTDLGLDWYDYGARWLDVKTGRWSTIDPLSEKFDAWSGYHYTLNNPINYTDPNGMDTLYINRYVYLDRYEDQSTLAYKVYFSLVSNGVETVVETPGGYGDMYLLTNANKEGEGDNSMTGKDEYVLNYQSMASHPEWENTILATSFNIFIHEGQNYGWSGGCKILCTLDPENVPLKTVEIPDLDTGKDKKISYAHLPLNNSQTALSELKSLYDERKPNLTGNKFMFRNIRRDRRRFDDKKGLVFPKPTQN